MRKSIKEISRLPPKCQPTLTEVSADLFEPTYYADILMAGSVTWAKVCFGIGGLCAVGSLARVVSAYRNDSLDKKAHHILTEVGLDGVPTLTKWRAELKYLQCPGIVLYAKWGGKMTCVAVNVDNHNKTVTTEYRQRFVYPEGYARKRTLLHNPTYFDPYTVSWDRYYYEPGPLDFFNEAHWVEAGSKVLTRPEPDSWSEVRPVRRCVNGECLDLHYEFRPPRTKQEYDTLVGDLTELPAASFADTLVLARSEGCDAGAESKDMY